MWWDRVLRKVDRTSHETQEKFCEKFRGPFSIIVVNANGITYQLRHCGSGVEVGVHHSQLRQYIDPPAYLLNHPCCAYANEDQVGLDELDCPAEEFGAFGSYVQNDFGSSDTSDSGSDFSGFLETD